MLDEVKFITLRKRHKKLIEDALDLPPEEWQKIKLSIPKRQDMLLRSKGFEDSRVQVKDEKNVEGNGYSPLLYPF